MRTVPVKFSANITPMAKMVQISNLGECAKPSTVYKSKELPWLIGIPLSALSQGQYAQGTFNFNAFIKYV